MKSKVIVWDKKNDKPLEKADGGITHSKIEPAAQTVPIEEYNKALDKIKTLESELAKFQAETDKPEEKNEETKKDKKKNGKKE
ncbi:hypothetical protein [Bacillus haynesii]|uniref:hypothetical protein n=1 Tax=Bacillus haynesii TaxID=1925021 RepID=UPI002282C112|nr:hypothetical protein [Bacillus haynesii]MCY8408966.1 hypothetical protein [Bacillus haynesii]MCY8433485.1 hypothetical protein [Bacillus haynesii]MCY8557835.1 hypothetical protein [Bacillus haynesii]